MLPRVGFSSALGCYIRPLIATLIPKSAWVSVFITHYKTCLIIYPYALTIWKARSKGETMFSRIILRIMVPRLTLLKDEQNNYFLDPKI